MSYKGIVEAQKQRDVKDAIAEVTRSLTIKVECANPSFSERDHVVKNWKRQNMKLGRWEWRNIVIC
jgi:hypothetical protein